MNISKRFSLPGTETAFAVAEEAKQYAKKGIKIYPFHLGDMNLRTPENIVRAAVRAIEKGKTGYCSNYGIPELREALTSDINNSHGTAYTADNVVIEPGGKPVIPKFFLALMNPSDEPSLPPPAYLSVPVCISAGPCPKREKGTFGFHIPVSIRTRYEKGLRF